MDGAREQPFWLSGQHHPPFDPGLRAQPILGLVEFAHHPLEHVCVSQSEFTAHACVHCEFEEHVLYGDFPLYVQYPGVPDGPPHTPAEHFPGLWGPPQSMSVSPQSCMLFCDSGGQVQ